MALTHGDLFAGIGGFTLAAQWCGIKTIWAVEIDPYCQAVYKKHFPDVEMFGDVKEIVENPKGNLRGTSRDAMRITSDGASPEQSGKILPPIDLLTGGFPCQPFSVAGKRRGADDDRYLWPEMLRIIRAIHPRWVIAENVPGIDDQRGMVLDVVISDLEGIGYQAIPLEIPACAVGAPHIRQRVWIVAYASGERRQQNARGPFSDEEADGRTRRELCESNENYIPPGGSEVWNVADANRGRQLQSQRSKPKEWGWACNGRWWTTEPDVGRVAHGVPARVDRLRALGNAIVPQVAEKIMRAIVEVDEEVGRVWP